MNNSEENDLSADNREPCEVEFFIIQSNANGVSGEFKHLRNTGTLIDQDSTGMGILTHVQLRPGDMIELDNEGTSKKGVVMWSVESSNRYRIQMRFV